MERKNCPTDFYDLMDTMLTPKEAAGYVESLYPNGKIPELTSHTVKAALTISRGSTACSLAETVRRVRASDNSADYVAE